MNQQPVDEPTEGAGESKIPHSTSGFRLVDDLLSESTNFVRDIGKKTINMIQEVEPLQNLQSSNLPNLSQMLQEAKQQNDEVAEGNSNNVKIETANFEQLLDDYQGCMSLEALEVLSNQSKMKIELLLKSFHDKKGTEELEETLDEVKELCDFDSESDFDSLDVTKMFSEVDLLDTNIHFTETVAMVQQVKEQLEEMKKERPHLICENGKKSLAKICALGLHNLHKFAESLLNKSHRSTASEAESLLEIATIYCQIFNFVASSFTEIITKDTDEGKKATTNMFLEVS